MSVPECLFLLILSVRVARTVWSVVSVPECLFKLALSVRCSLAVRAVWSVVSVPECLFLLALSVRFVDYSDSLFIGR